MKFFLTFILSLLTFSAFSQQNSGTFQYLDVQRRLTLAGRTAKGISIDTAMVNASVDSLVTQYALKGYLYNKIGPGNVFGDQHQQVVIKRDNTNEYEAIEPIVEGIFVSTDAELNAAKQVFIDQQTIFSTWKRFSHGGGTVNAPALSNNIPGKPLETNSWSYNAGTGQINSTLNSATFIGFISPQKYSSYNNKIRLAATAGADFSDNDYLVTVIAYVEDPNDLVPNTAYGMTSTDFSWPINTTDPFIPNQHTISLVRGRTTQPLFPLPMQYSIVYDLGKTNEQVLANGDALVWNTNEPYAGHFCDVQVIRQGDIIKTYTTNWDDAPGGVGTLSHELTLDLSLSALTQKFRGAASFGYGALSQENSSFTNLASSSNINVIYDVRDGQVWTADVPGNYQIDTSRSFYKDFGVRRLVYNPTTAKTIYVNGEKNFRIIGQTNVIDSIADDYIFNDEDFLVINRNVSLIPKSEIDPLFLSSVASAITAADTTRWGHIQFNDSTFLDDRDFSDSGTVTNPIRTKPLVITSIGTIPSYDHDTKILNIPTGGGTSSRFGIEDNTGAANRDINFSNSNSFSLRNTSQLELSATGATSGSYITATPNSMQVAQFRSNSASPSTDYTSYIDFTRNIVVRFDSAGNTSQIKFPHTVGQYVSPISVNGNFADASGNITVTATGGSSGVTSFNSRTGVVVPDVADYSAYYAAISHTHTASQITDFMSAARSAISLTTTGTSGVATYDNSTGVLNIPNYATSGGGTGWNLGGNTLTNSGTQYLGTNNLTSLRFRVNTSEQMVIDSLGNVGIGGSASGVKLRVNGAISGTSDVSANNNITANGSIVSAGQMQARATLSVNTTSFTVNGLAQVDIASTTRGVLVPRMAAPPTAKVVTAINVTNGGSGYTSAPSVTVQGGVANATAVVSGGQVTSVTLNHAIVQTATVPTITFTGGGGTGASATAVIGTTEGLYYYCTTHHGLEFYNGTSWQLVTSTTVH